jgi:hypothetical protein
MNAQARLPVYEPTFEDLRRALDHLRVERRARERPAVDDPTPRPCSVCRRKCTSELCIECRRLVYPGA